MIKGLFKLTADRNRMAALAGSPEFRFYVDKLRHALAKADEDVRYCTVRDLPDRRAYARCLHELIEESTKPPGATP
jgi:hypothetical protein